MRSALDHLPEWLKLSIDAASFTALLGSLTAMLPSIAGLLTVIWTLMRMYETALTIRQKTKEIADARSSEDAPG